jgi:hypothetical protein
VGALALEAETWLKLGLLWLLADPILGTIWHLLTVQQVWQRLRRPELPAHASLPPILPYLTQKSPGYRLILFLANMRAQPDGAGYTLLIASFLAVSIGFVLGWPALIYVLLVLLLAFSANLNTNSSEKTGHPLLLQSIATFLLPFTVGTVLFGSFTWVILLLALSYWIAYLGSLQLLSGESFGTRFAIWGQGAATILLFGLREPLIGVTAAIALIFSLLLKRHADDRGPMTAIWYSERLQPFLLISLLITTLSLGAG